jgi:hypothetical protein
MAQQPEVVQSLAKISTSHAVFEPDQVLTHGQLNGITDYLDDQQRLTRVELLGVGIVDGLRVDGTGGKVAVSKGVGVTTDGDLLVLTGDAVFDRFKAYGEKAPRYAPLYNGGTMRKAYELVREGESDTLAQPLAQLPAPGLAGMVAMMLMESYEADQDLCTSTDCDNQGRDAIHTIRLLLIPRSEASALQTALATVAQSAKKLPRLHADRPALGGAITTIGALAALYRDACGNTHSGLSKALGELHQQLPALTLELFGKDPGPGWVTLLNNHQATFKNSSNGIQYYYDFLKDLVETWNALRDALLDSDFVLCPNLAAFPKHVLLGDLADARQSRTGFYPSPLTGGGRQHLDHAAFLARKLHVLINTFAPPAATPDIRVTPSRGESESLEYRAIPYYYETDSQLPILHAWNWRQEKRGSSGELSGYRAKELGASATVQELLSCQIGQYDFFRIEGHLGQDLDTVMDKLEAEVANHNLPFVLRAVLLHNNRDKLKRKPTKRYYDLHRMHRLLRMDVAATLDDGRDMGTALHAKIGEAINNGSVPDTMENTKTLDLSDNLRKELESAVGNTASVLGAKSYVDYRQQAAKSEKTWKSDYRMAVDASSKYKRTFGNVLRTDHSTAFDTLVSDSRVRWLDWLDLLIQDKDERADDRLLFASFLKEHPGIEHFGGVLRGGTFVVVYDDNAKVVADFMLPYACLDSGEDEPEQEPELTLPPYKAKDFYQFGYQVIPPLDLRLQKQLDSFELKIQPKWQAEIKLQDQYLQKSLDLYGKAVKGAQIVVPGIEVGVSDIKDRTAGYYAGNIARESARLDQIRDTIHDPETPDEVRTQMQKEQVEVEMKIAEAVGAASQYVASANIDVAKGSDGEKVLGVISQGAGKVTGTMAREVAGQGLKDALNKQGVGDVQKGAIDKIAKINKLQF